MQSLFSRPFGKLDEDDLRDLVEVRKVREYIQLEYKDKLPSHGHTDTVEFLADVTAMANAQGGYILIGVEEDKGQPDGTPKSLIGIGDGDAEANWIQSVCLSSIDEKIPGLQVRDIPIANGLSCVVISIPNSVRKPHMVVHEKHRSFRMRHVREKSLMGMQEVRNMILSMNAYRASLAEFIAERKRALKEIAKEEPALLLMVTPIYVDSDKFDPLRDDVRNTLAKAPGFIDDGATGVVSVPPQPRIFGIEVGYHYTSEGQPQNHFRLFRNGHLEYSARLRHTKKSSDEPLKIYSHQIATNMVRFLELGAQLMSVGEISEPILITLHIENCNPSLLYRWRRYEDFFLHQSDNLFIWREPNLSLQFTVTDLAEPQNLARATINNLFNAYGYADNPHFDADGNLVVWK